MISRDFLGLKWATRYGKMDLPTIDEETHKLLHGCWLSVCDLGDDSPSDTVYFKIHNGRNDDSDDGIDVRFGMDIEEVLKLRNFLTFLIEHTDSISGWPRRT
jgi:hypothetical protein